MISRNALKFDWRVKYLYHYNDILCIGYAKFNPFPKVKGKIQTPFPDSSSSFSIGKTRLMTTRGEFQRMNLLIPISHRKLILKAHCGS